MYFYLLLINALALLFMCLDKQFAKLHKRRIPAAVLLGLIAGVWTLTDKLTALLEKKH